MREGTGQRWRGFRLAAVAASHDLRLRSHHGLFGMQAIVLIGSGMLDPLPSGLGQTIYHLNLGVVLGGKPAQNHNIYILWLYGSLHTL